VLAQLSLRLRQERLGAIAMIAIAASGFGGCGSDNDRPKANEEAYSALLRAARLADRLSTAGGYPFATSLANQLHLSDPETTYEPLSSPAEVARRGAIGVYTTSSTLWLSMHAPNGLVVQLRRVDRGPARGTYGPTAITPSGLANGDFTTPLSDTWTIRAGRIARVKRDSEVSASAPASLRVRGTGDRSRAPTLVYQTIQPLEPRAVGTVYTLNLVARTHNLSRRLFVETKLEYRDGSYEFFVAAPQGPGGRAVSGIQSGSSRGWIPLQSRAVARKPATRLTVYAVDTGVTPLRGSAWIDDVTLTATKP
jgi:hypothetical protein